MTPPSIVLTLADLPSLAARPQVLFNDGGVFHTDVRQISAMMLERILDGRQHADSPVPEDSVTKLADRIESLLAGAKQYGLQSAMVSMLREGYSVLSWAAFVVYGLSGLPDTVAGGKRAKEEL